MIKFSFFLLKLEKQLNSVSQVAAIIHNDFYHLSQEILGLAFEVCISYYLLLIMIYLGCWFYAALFPESFLLIHSFATCWFMWVFGWFLHLWSHYITYMTHGPMGRRVRFCHKCGDHFLVKLCQTLFVAKLASDQAAP